MAEGRYIAYFRVSTAKQGSSGLGIEAQQEAVRRYLNGGNWQLLDSFTEVETGTKKKRDRPQLARALERCRLTGATLVIAKLDRLARDTLFLLTIVEGTGEAGVVFCDLPTIPSGPVGKFQVTQMAAVAELEAGLISQRTKDALAASKARGTNLGGWRGGPKVDPAVGLLAVRMKADAFAARVRPVVHQLSSEGRSLREVAIELVRQGIMTPRGGQWSADAVRRLLLRNP